VSCKNSPVTLWWRTLHHLTLWIWHHALLTVVVLRPWPLTPTEGQLWHAMWRVHTVGQAGVKLSPPQLYCLREFREGTLTWLSLRVQSFIWDRQGFLAPWKLPFLTLTIRALGIAADDIHMLDIEELLCWNINEVVARKLYIWCFRSVIPNTGRLLITQEDTSAAMEDLERLLSSSTNFTP